MRAVRYRFGNWSFQWFLTGVWCFGLAAVSFLAGIVVAVVEPEVRWGALGVGAGIGVFCGVLGVVSLVTWSRRYVEIDAERMIVRSVTVRGIQEFPAGDASARIAGQPSLLFPGSLQLRNGEGGWVDANAVGQGYLRQPKQLEAFAAELLAIGVELQRL